MSKSRHPLVKDVLKVYRSCNFLERTVLSLNDAQNNPLNLTPQDAKDIEEMLSRVNLMAAALRLRVQKSVKAIEGDTIL